MRKFHHFKLTGEPIPGIPAAAPTIQYLTIGKYTMRFDASMNHMMISHRDRQTVALEGEEARLAWNEACELTADHARPRQPYLPTQF